MGDALGAAVEFMSLADIRARFGPDGLSGYAPVYGGIGRITDDTQMTLFTAEGLLRGVVRHNAKGICSYPSVVANAYLRWLTTQGEGTSCEAALQGGDQGWLIGHTELHARRAPGNTCLSTLRTLTHLGDRARNSSKGCGGVMRVAPVGLFGLGEEAGRVFELAAEVAAITHGHPTGSLPAGVLAVLVHRLACGESMAASLHVAKACLIQRAAHEETLQAIEAAEALGSQPTVSADTAIRSLGKGWIAEEALSISLYCALVAKDFRHGVLAAVNHDGDSDSTGAITGNLLGVRLGEAAIPSEWLAPLELREVIAEMADDLLDCREWPAIDDALWKKYPGF